MHKKTIIKNLKWTDSSLHECKLLQQQKEHKEASNQMIQKKKIHNEYGPGWINSPNNEEWESETCSGTSRSEECVKTE